MIGASSPLVRGTCMKCQLLSRIGNNPVLLQVAVMICKAYRLHQSTTLRRALDHGSSWVQVCIGLLSLDDQLVGRAKSGLRRTFFPRHSRDKVNLRIEVFLFERTGVKPERKVGIELELELKVARDERIPESFGKNNLPLRRRSSGICVWAASNIFVSPAITTILASHYLYVIFVFGSNNTVG